jgi:hypothetical protein
LLQLKWSLIITLIVVAASWVFGGISAALTVLLLALLEISVSFDNAIVNAGILKRMNPFWQRLFLTVGIVIAVFGVRLLLPLLIVSVSAGIDPVNVSHKALAGGGSEQPGTYGYLLEQAHPAISAFGGIFLLVLALDFFFTDRRIRWLGWIERPLAKLGEIRLLSVAIGLATLLVISLRHGIDSPQVLTAGAIGLLLYICINGLARVFAGSAGATGKAGLFLFLYLQVLDASFSFDGVIGAFAISSDVLVIAAGLGIGAVFIRSLTVMMVRRGTLASFRFLEHGAHWAIAALALILLVDVSTPVPGFVTGLVGALIIVSSLLHSIRLNYRKKP